MAKKKKNINLLNKRTSFSYLQISLFLLVFGALGVFAVLQSLAAPPTKPLSATLALSPNPVTGGQRYDISGCGYEAKPVHIVISDGTQYGAGVWADGGCIKGYATAGTKPGTYTVEAYQDSNGKKRMLKASTTLTIQ